jgi:hypothetical protein
VRVLPIHEGPDEKEGVSAKKAGGGDKTAASAPGDDASLDAKLGLYHFLSNLRWARI